MVITHGNVLTNVAPLETEIQKYLKYERWFHPVRFLNLLPLSHVFGQFLGMFLPSIMAGTVIFQESLEPSEVMQTIRRERVSVLVAVPRMLQSLKDKARKRSGKGREGRRPSAPDSGVRKAGPFLRRALDLPAICTVGWAGNSGHSFRVARRWITTRKNLESLGICSDSGIWAYRDYFAGERESSISPGERIDRENSARSGSEIGAGWRNLGSRWWEWLRAHWKGNRSGPSDPTIYVTDDEGWYRTAIWVVWMRRGIFISRAQEGCAGYTGRDERLP